MTRIRQLALGAVLVAVAVPAATVGTAAAASSAARSAAAWREVAGTPPATHNGARPAIRPERFRALALDRRALARVLAGAPRERTSAARTAPLTISLPAPDGRQRRFAIHRSSAMEPGLAAAHPEIATYAGTGVDDRGASVRLDLTPLGFHASVRGPGGSWYVDPYYHRDQSLYVSYRGADLVANLHGSFVEHDVLGARAPRRAAGREALVGPAVQLRTYRLALVSDPTYAAYHGADNVTAAKVTLINRVNQIYEDDFAIHLSLVADNDLLNLDTAAEMTGANGPCGAAPCYTADQAEACDVPTLDRTRVVIGQLIGASDYDVGHIGMGNSGGGIAYLGVVGDDLKGGGCTGVTQPIGDLFAVDYVAHEIGHQFSGNHTFNGVDGACGGNIAGTSVEPGSGITIMAYAGICGTDDLQPHSDPYFSQRSIDEVTDYTGADSVAVNEVQIVSLRGFSGTDSFRLSYNGAQSAVITRGTNYTSAGIATAIKGIAGFPAAGTVTVVDWDDGGGAPTDAGFAVRFGGTLANTDVSPLGVTSPVGTTGFVGETAQGGPSRNGGAVSATGNRAPEVVAPAGFTIPARTPFSLTGSATDADDDTLVYLWEQNDAGSGTSLVSNTKPNGPLFRVFGTAAIVSPTDTLLSPSPGQNAAGTSPTRVFPDLAQIVAGNTNAATGTCPAAGDPVAPATVDCYSEFLPTAAYAGQLHFRLTARDTNPAGGGVAHDDTTLTLAAGSGPFRVSSQAASTSVEAGDPLTVTWSVAGTNAAPVGAANVRITLSTDGGETFPTVLSASTPNDGTHVVTVPSAATTTARIKVEAVGNVFFDVNHADIAIVGAPVAVDDAPAGGATAQYSDALAQTVTISASDADSPGSALTATATGLPTGLSLPVATTSAGARTWTVGGETTAAPGTYPVAVTVDDGAGHQDSTAFDVVVTAEDALATYAGPALVTGPAGAAQAPVTLSFNVADAPDATAGDVATATVTFMEGTATLCTAQPVVTAGDPRLGSATCAANLSTGATHHVEAVIGGRYQGAGAGDVQVTAASGPVTPGPPANPVAAVFAPDLGKVAKRLRLSKSGRVSIRLSCRTVAAGSAPSPCTGTLKLRARVKGKQRTVGSGSFSVNAGATKTVKVRLTAKARRALKKATSARLTVVVANGGAPRKATKKVKLVPRKR